MLKIFCDAIKKDTSTYSNRATEWLQVFGSDDSSMYNKIETWRWSLFHVKINLNTLLS